MVRSDVFTARGHRGRVSMIHFVVVIMLVFGVGLVKCEVVRHMYVGTCRHVVS